jgi:hypothetical protein
MQNQTSSAPAMSAGQLKHYLLIHAAQRRQQWEPDEEIAEPAPAIESPLTIGSRRVTAPRWSAIHD